MSRFPLPAVAATACMLLCSPVLAAKPANPDILVTAQRREDALAQAPASHAAITAAEIAATVNAVNVEDAIKYLPSLIVRKRHIGDTQAPIATRTSGLGSSARSLVYADGALLSALIGNNNTNASPRWGLVSPQEIARIDVLYGPFSAAYPGNSIGAVVSITTRMPEHLEATLSTASNVQRFRQYGTDATLPARQVGGTIGDRFGPLSLFASAEHVNSRSQPLLFVTAQPGAAAGARDPATGGVPALNRAGQPIRVLGASGFEHQEQDRFKLKAALDVGGGVRLSYAGGLFLNDTDAHAETYLADLRTGRPAYAGNLTLAGQPYAIAASAFDSGVYRYDERHWSHAVTAAGAAAHFDWRVVGTLYDYAHDVQRMPTTALPGALAGGAGTITRLNGTGWRTLDGQGSWRSDDAGTNALSFGAHGDWFRLRSDRFATADWRGGEAGPLNLQSRGRTRTAAAWAQGQWRFAPALTLTVGGRYEWWRAYGGRNFSLLPLVGPVDQPALSAHHFSPKASLAWDPAHDWTVRASFGQAWRFPTVGELYQIVTTPVPSVPNPDLRPERARSEELAVERHDAHGSVRLSLFNEATRDALISQVGPLAGTTQFGTYVQNVPRTRARGVELAVQRTDAVPRVDLSGSLTYADAETRADPNLPGAVGKALPQVPRWKATAVATWRPVDPLSLTAALRYSSRQFGTLDNSDPVGNTYQGFYRFLVVDLRAELKVARHWRFGLGVDNVNDDRYFLFHPFPQRSVQADLTWTL